MENLKSELNDLFKGKIFLTAEEVADLLGCSKKSLYSLHRNTDKERRPPFISIGKTIRYPKSDFIQWLIQYRFKKELV